MSRRNKLPNGSCCRRALPSRLVGRMESVAPSARNFHLAPMLEPLAAELGR
jgi:hypothetical protein